MYIRVCTDGEGLSSLLVLACLGALPGHMRISSCSALRVYHPMPKEYNVCIEISICVCYRMISLAMVLLFFVPAAYSEESVAGGVQI